MGKKFFRKFGNYYSTPVAGAANSIYNNHQKLKNSYPITPNVTHNPPKPKNEVKTPIFDSGCTDSAYKENSVPESVSVNNSAHPITLKLPNGSTITAQGDTEFSHGPFTFRPHVFDDKILNRSLQSVSEITSQGGSVLFTNDCAYLYDVRRQLVSAHPKSPSDKLWSMATVDRDQPALSQSPEANLTVRNESDAEFVLYAHAVFGSPPPSTLYRALGKGWLSSFGRLTQTMVYQNWPNTVATAQGHLQLQRQGVRSTKPARHPVTPIEAAANEDLDFIEEAVEEPGSVLCQVFDRKDAVFADAAGRYPIPSIDGEEYMLVVVFKNYIHVETMRDRTSSSYVRAYRRAILFYRSRNHVIASLVLDNEVSAALLELFDELHVKFQNVPPGNKRSNKAERAIQSWRNHFLSTMGTVSADCPHYVWSKFIEQMELTLAHLRPFETDRTISSFEGIHGRKYDFAAHPIAICGTPVYIYENSDTRAAWSTHGVPGFYLGPVVDGYRTFNCWVTSTASERGSDSVHFFPAPYRLPGSSIEEVITVKLESVRTAILSSGDKIATRQILNELVEIENILAWPNTADRLRYVEPGGPLIDDTATKQGVSPSLPPVAKQGVPKAPKNPLQQRKLKSKPYSKREKPPLYRSLLPTEKSGKINQYLVKVGKRFTDIETDEVFKIMDVKLPNVNGGAGSQTPHFELCPIHQLDMQPPHRQLMYTRCSEILSAKYVAWIKDSPSINAITSTEPHDGSPLNIRDGKKLSLNKELKGKNSSDWKLADREEFMRLFDSNTMVGVRRSDVPRGEVISYLNRQLKEKLIGVKNVDHVDRRVRGTYGGDRSNYSGITASQTAEYPVVKVLLNAVVSDIINKDPATRFATADMVDFYLGTEMDEPSYLSVPAEAIGDELIDMYNLRELICGKNITFVLKKAMYGHPAAGRLSNKKLVKILKDGGYDEDEYVDCLFKHRDRNITFVLVVDDMGIKYSREEDLQHLIDTITPYWKLKVDRTGTKFVGMRLKWEYDRKPKPRVTIDAPTVIPDALLKFRTGGPKTGRETPSPYTEPVYGARVQTAPFEDSPAAPPGSAKRIQQITGTLSHYSRVIDPTMQEAVATLAMSQANPTVDTMLRADHLLDYAARFPNNAIVYEASDMILTSSSDASYQSLKNSRSKAGGEAHFADEGELPSHNNGVIATICKVISVVCAGVSEAEYIAAFELGRLLYFLRLAAEAMGYPQQATTIYVDNDVARGIANRTVKVKRSKSIEKSFHWIRCKVDSGVFTIKRVSGEDNLSDYFTKSLPRCRHVELRNRLVTVQKNTALKAVTFSDIS